MPAIICDGVDSALRFSGEWYSVPYSALAPGEIRRLCYYRCYKVSLGNYEITYPLWDLAELMLDEQMTYKEVNNIKMGETTQMVKKL